MIPNQRLFTVSKAAKYLGIHGDTLRKYADNGQIPVYRFNGRRVFKREDLDRLIESLSLWNDAAAMNSRAGRDRETS